MTAVPQPPAEQRGDVGRCGDAASAIAGIASTVAYCALPAGHAGWHKSDDGGEWTRRESGGQQQAAAEVARAYFGNVFGTDVEHVDVESKQLTKLIAAALAEAARPGQELRQRVRALERELSHWASRGRGEKAAAYSHVAEALRAALEDPR